MAQRGPVAGFFEHGNETSGFTKCWEFLAQLSDCQIFKMDSATWSYVWGKYRDRTVVQAPR